MAHTMEEVMSPKALVCRREHVCNHGGATIYSVMLADGFLLECGSSNYAEDRAQVLAEIINAAGPERLSRDAFNERIKF